MPAAACAGCRRSTVISGTASGPCDDETTNALTSGIVGPVPICWLARGSGRASSCALADTLAALIAEAYTFDTPGALDRMNELYPAEGRVISAGAGHMTTTADSLRAGIVSFWEQAGQNMRDAQWQWDTVEVDRLAPDAAVLTGTWSIPHIAPAGNEHIIRGAWTAVFRRLDGEWKIIQEHLSVPAG